MREIYFTAVDFNNTVTSIKNLKGKKELRFIFYSILLFALMFFSAILFVWQRDFYLIVPMLLSELLFIIAIECLSDFKKINVLENINKFCSTPVNLKDFEYAKSEYIKFLLTPYGKDPFDSIKRINDIRQINKKENLHGVKEFSSNIKNLIYEKESKGRILSLFIYLLGIIGIVFIVKNENQQSVLQVFSDALTSDYFNIVLVVSIYVFAAIILTIYAIKTFYHFFVLPFLLILGSEEYLIRNLIYESSKYCFYDQEKHNLRVKENNWAVNFYNYLNRPTRDIFEKIKKNANTSMNADC